MCHRSHHLGGICLNRMSKGDTSHFSVMEDIAGFPSRKEIFSSATAGMIMRGRHGKGYQHDN